MEAVAGFGLVALAAAAFAGVTRWLAGRGPTLAIGGVLTVLCAAGGAWAWVDAQSKTGFDAIASAIFTMFAVVVTVGWWIGVALAGWWVRARDR